MKKIILSLIFVFILFSLSVQAKDVVYVARNIDNNFLNAINDLNLSYDIINDNDITNTNFFNYKLILVGNDVFANANNIPVDKLNSLIVNIFHADDFGITRSNPNSAASSQPLIIKNIDTNKFVTSGLGNFTTIYTSCCFGNGISVPVYSLSRANPISRYIVSSNVNDLDAVIAVNFPGIKLLNNKISFGRVTFFGITESDFWTNEARELFKRSLAFTLNGYDGDNDSYDSILVGGLDCNDNNVSIHPGAIDIPYDGIDQNCDGHDLTDVDNDGYSSIIIGGNDCNDNNVSIHLGAVELLDDVDQNCVNDKPILLSQLPGTIFAEDTIRNNVYNLSSYFKDPDGDLLTFKAIGNSQINISIINGMASLMPKLNFFGAENILFNASDSKLSTLSNNVILIVTNTNDAPFLIGNIHDLIWDEDTNYTLNLSNYFRDPDNDVLSFTGLSNSNISVNIINGIANLIPKKDFFGNQTIVFNVSDGFNTASSNRIDLIINNINDAPILINNIPDISFDEDTIYNLNLSNYFKDFDNDILSYVISGNNFVSAVFDSKFANFSAPKDWNGNDTIVLFAFDRATHVQSNLVNINLRMINDAPKILSVDILDQNNNNAISIYENQNYIFRANTFDVENDALTYQWFLNNQLINTNNEFNYTFDFNSQGSNVLRLIVKDNSLETSKNLSLDIKNLNRKPYFLTEETIFKLLEDEERLFDLKARDNDNDSLIFKALNGKNIECSVVNNRLRVKPQLDWNGEDSCNVIVSDGELTSSLKFNFIVVNADDSPRILFYNPSSTNIRIKQNTELNFNVSATDPEKQFLDYKWYVNNNLTGFKDHIGLKFNNLGINNVKVVISDGNLASELTWTITVIENIDTNYFDGETTDLFNVDLTKINNFILEKTTFGKILFLDKVSLGQNKDFKNNVIINNNIVGVNSVNIPELNKKARITLYHQAYTNFPSIFKSTLFINNPNQINQVCNDCKLIRYTQGPTNDGEVVFEVNGFSTYTLKDNSSVINNSNNLFCKNGNKGNVQLKINNLDKDVTLGEDSIFNLEVKNVDSAVDYKLLDENKEVVLEDSLNINEDEAEEIKLELHDFEEGNYNLIIKAYDENNEQGSCNEKSFNIRIKAKDHNIKVNNFIINPSVLKCGERAYGDISLQNFGKKNEDNVNVRVYNKELNLNFETNNLHLSKFGNSNDKTRIHFSFLVPDNLNKNSYDLDLSLSYADQLDVTKTVKVNGCEFEIEQPNEFKLLQIEINSNNDGSFTIPVEVINNKNTRSSFIVELSDGSVEKTSKTVLIEPLQSEIIYLNGKLNENVNGKYDVTVNLIQDGKIINSRIANIKFNKKEIGLLEYLLSFLGL